MYTFGDKNVPLYFCPYLRQLLTNFFTGRLSGQFAIMWLLYITPHRKVHLYITLWNKCEKS